MFEYQLQYDKEKYLITKPLYTLLITETNHIGDYGQCRRFVRTAISKYAKDVQPVKDFAKKRRDIIEL